MSDMCKNCLTHEADRTDEYGNQKPICECCMDYLDRSRWAAEHGMPVPPRDKDIVCGVLINGKIEPMTFFSGRTYVK